MAAGTDASSTLAPAAAEALGRPVATRAATSASMPSISSRTMPTRSPSTPSAHGARARRAPARRIDVESMRVVAGDDLEQQGGVGHGRRERPDLVESELAKAISP